MRSLFNLVMVRYQAASRALGLVARGARTGRAGSMLEGGSLLLAWFLTRRREPRHQRTLELKPGTTMFVRVRRADEEPLGAERVRALLEDQTR